VIRAHGEAILRSFKEESVCNLFKAKPKSSNHKGSRGRDKNKNQKVEAPGPIACSHRIEKRGSTPPQWYARSCPACKLFGSLVFGGRFNIWDAYATASVPSEFRDSVCIDRFTGGSYGSGKFQFEVITSGVFETTLTIKNFEMWQLAWVMVILKDMADGLVPIGMGTSRGLGKIKLEILGVTVDCFSRKPVEALYGVDLGRSDLLDYGIRQSKPIKISDQWEMHYELPRSRVQIPKQEIPALDQELRSFFATFLQGLQSPRKERQAV
jgi:CRISPR/Cas system CSM-associated protein Csm3 (group 7 of RAMP superfamily)